MKGGICNGIAGDAGPAGRQLGGGNLLARAPESCRQAGQQRPLPGADILFRLAATSAWAAAKVGLCASAASISAFSSGLWKSVHQSPEISPRGNEILRVPPAGLRRRGRGSGVSATCGAGGCVIIRPHGAGGQRSPQAQRKPAIVETRWFHYFQLPGFSYQSRTETIEYLFIWKLASFHNTHMLARMMGKTFVAKLRNRCADKAEAKPRMARHACWR